MVKDFGVAILHFAAKKPLWIFCSGWNTANNQGHQTIPDLLSTRKRWSDFSLCSYGSCDCILDSKMKPDDEGSSHSNRKAYDDRKLDNSNT